MWRPMIREREAQIIGMFAAAISGGVAGFAFGFLFRTWFW